MLSYGSGLAEDDPERVVRARKFISMVRKRFAKLLNDDLRRQMQEQPARRVQPGAAAVADSRPDRRL